VSHEAIHSIEAMIRNSLVFPNISFLFLGGSVVQLPFILSEEMFNDLRLLSLLGALLYSYYLECARGFSAVFGKPVTGSFFTLIGGQYHTKCSIKKKTGQAVRTTLFFL
jgi:hypothetical protein